MDPFTIMALGSLGLGAANMIKGWGQGRNQDPYMQVGSADDVVNINPYTDAAMAGINTDMSNVNNLLMGSLGRGQGFQGQAAGAFSDLMAFNPTVNYDPMAAQRMFNAASPSLQAAAQGAVSPIDVGALQGQIGEQVANQYQGNPNSGAFVRTIADALIAPEVNARMQEQQLRANLFNALARQAMSGFQQGNVASGRFQQASNAQRGQSMAQGAQGMSGLAGQAFNNLGVFGSLLGNLQQQRAALGRQEWWQPTYLNNPNFIGARDYMNMGAQMVGAGVNMFPGDASFGDRPEVPNSESFSGLNTLQRSSSVPTLAQPNPFTGAAPLGVSPNDFPPSSGLRGYMPPGITNGGIPPTLGPQGIGRSPFSFIPPADIPRMQWRG